MPLHGSAGRCQRRRFHSLLLPHPPVKGPTISLTLSSLWRFKQHPAAAGPRTKALFQTGNKYPEGEDTVSSYPYAGWNTVACEYGQKLYRHWIRARNGYLLEPIIWPCCLFGEIFSCVQLAASVWLPRGKSSAWPSLAFSIKAHGLMSCRISMFNFPERPYCVWLKSLLM